MYLEMDGTLNFDCFNLGETFHIKNVTQTHSIFVKCWNNTFLGMLKVKTWYIFTLAMGQNLENSESCLVLRLL